MVLQWELVHDPVVALLDTACHSVLLLFILFLFFNLSSTLSCFQLFQFIEWC